MVSFTFTYEDIQYAPFNYGSIGDLTGATGSTSIVGSSNSDARPYMICRYTMTPSEDVRVSTLRFTVGVRSSQALTCTLLVEATTDGTTWSTVQTYTLTNYVRGSQGANFDASWSVNVGLNSSLTYKAFRMRMTVPSSFIVKPYYAMTFGNWSIFSGVVASGLYFCPTSSTPLQLAQIISSSSIDTVAAQYPVMLPTTTSVIGLPTRYPRVGKIPTSCPGSLHLFRLNSATSTSALTALYSVVITPWGSS